jgi:electron transport complex protein RnfB
MHTVLVDECNGCGLCLPPCPVDCIALLPVSVTPDPGSLWPEYTRAETERWRTRTRARVMRLAGRKTKRPRVAPVADPNERERMRAEIRAAVERVRARRAAKT